ncbi:MAG: zinc metallopeptidase [Clostridia bacterium]|nr:zinc metallopeptidase [Clostridia bacterium]
MDFIIIYYILGIIMIPGIIFAAYTQIKIQSAYSQYSEIKTIKGVPAKDVAKQVLERNGLFDVEVKQISGHLTDNFNPKTKVVSLSESVYNSSSIASVGVALHEVGHAIQHAKNYGPAKMRLWLVPMINISSTILWPLIIIGVIIGSFAGFDNTLGQVFTWAGIIFFGLSVLFSLITLPTELDASRRAKKELAEIGAMNEEELAGVKKVLWAAAMTYIASLVVSILTLLRFVLTILLIRRND